MQPMHCMTSETPINVIFGWRPSDPVAQVSLVQGVVTSATGSSCKGMGLSDTQRTRLRLPPNPPSGPVSPGLEGCCLIHRVQAGLIGSNVYVLGTNRNRSISEGLPHVRPGVLPLAFKAAPRPIAFVARCGDSAAQTDGPHHEHIVIVLGLPNGDLGESAPLLRGYRSLPRVWPA